MEARRRTTRIYDVAERAGVSVGTVSHVLNHPARVTPATRERVLQAIDDLGFVRNANASTLAAGHSRNVGLVAIDLGNSMFVDIANGAQSAARPAGLDLLLAGSEDDYETQASKVAFFDEARVSGLILAPMQDSAEQIDRFRRHRRPVVVVNYDHQDPGICSVVVDNESVGRLAAEHLLSLGRRRLLFVGGDNPEIQPVHLRWLGVERSVSGSDVAASVDTRDTADLEPASGLDVAKEILAMPREARPDGVIAVTDGLAAGIIEGLTAAGVDVPADIAVMGCDHNTSAWTGQLPLTTVAMRGREIGATAMQLLLEELDQSIDHEHRRVVLEPYLLARASTVGWHR